MIRTGWSPVASRLQRKIDSTGFGTQILATAENGMTPRRCFGYLGKKATFRDGNVVFANDVDNVLDGSDEVLAIAVGEAIVPSSVQCRLIGSIFDAELVESLGIDVEMPVECRFVVPVVVEADQVRPRNEFEIGSVGVSRWIGVIDRFPSVVIGCQQRNA